MKNKVLSGAFDSVKEKILSKYTKNFSYLSLFEIVRILVPFLTYPFLIKKLGAEVFGLVIFAQTVVSYFNVLIDYGFNISAVKSVAENDDDLIQLSHIVSSVNIIKAAFFLFSLLIMGLFIFFVDALNQYWLLYLLSMGYCINATIVPIWFFQGIEKMKNITVVSFISKMIYLGFVFLFIRQPGDYFLVPLFSLVGGIVAGLISYWILVTKYKIKLNLVPDFKMITQMLYEGFPLFMSRLSSVFNMSVGKIVTGVFLGMDKVAVYDLAQRIVDVFKIPFSMLNQAIFPEVARTKNMGLVRQTIKLVLFFGLLSIVGIYFAGDFLINLLGSGELSNAEIVLLILSPTVLFSGLSYFYGNTVLIVKGFVRQFNMSVFWGVASYLFIIFVLWITNLLSVEALAFGNVIVTLIIFGYRWSFAMRRHLLKIN